MTLLELDLNGPHGSLQFQLSNLTLNMTPCRYFLKGFCRYGDDCKFTHGHHIGSRTQVIDSAHVHSTPDRCLRSPSETPSQAPSDSRAMVPCKYLSRVGGCRKSMCPYSHRMDKNGSEQNSVLDVGIAEKESEDPDNVSIRDFAGASVSFNEFDHVLKVSLPTDFSRAIISDFALGTSVHALADVIRGLGLDVSVDSIRMLASAHEQEHWHASTPQPKAIVKAENPLFATELKMRLESRNSGIGATPLPTDVRRTNCRKVYISWYKATRNAWLNFGNQEIAKRVAQRFSEGKYQILGRYVVSSAGRKTSGQRSGRGFSCNPVAWTITLSNVPKEADLNNTESAIVMLQDKPRHIEMSPVSYQASPAEVSVDVRSLLEQYGHLENFVLAPETQGKRAKATASYQNEADARSACALNGRPIPILNGGKLTVTHVQSAKVKVPTTVYLVSKNKIELARKTWNAQHLSFNVYSDASQRFSTLKVEGENAKNVASARKVLDSISSGVLLADGESAIWHPALMNNGNPYAKLRSIERELDVKILRDKSRRQLQFFGPPENFHGTVRRVLDILRAESSTSHEVNLEPHQFQRMIQGGFRDIERALGMNVATFNVVLKKIIINGTLQQYNIALAITDGESLWGSEQSLDHSSVSGTDCPICFCDAEDPVPTSCKHTYCQECFEEYCKSAATTSEDEFRIKCQGGKGNCTHVFSLVELKNHLPSLTFEKVLMSSCEEYIQRHTEAFRYCPTPDCGYIYRCAQDSGLKSLAHTCPSCFETICTSCHARHGGYSCADYKDIASGGYKALERLKRELNIKDCPKCTTPMEKTEGCNHMTCGGCRSHICWVCMAVFETSGLCYEHMNKEHGGNGLQLLHWVD